jgi:hypothetical protein
MRREHITAPRVRNAAQVLSLSCLGLRRAQGDTLVGIATLRFNELKLVLHDVELHARGGDYWAVMPTRLYGDGGLVIDDDGRPKLQTVVQFESSPKHEVFSRIAWIAAFARYPELREELEGEGRI